uniref:Trehalose synthase N-terminal domain-containing protein n=1 Tax=Desulfobacca acetoxidans TaxID=60893 RepID=A0A7V4G9T6_9BACT
MIGLSDYAPIVGPEVIGQLQRLAEALSHRRFVHINSTRTGGGVAEILNRAVPLLNQLGLETHWEVIEGDSFFFEITKAMHNALQGYKIPFTQAMFDHYREVNLENARRAAWEADYVLLHDPQPAYMITALRPRAKNWVWRCHIDVSRPNFQVWRFLREVVSRYDASVFSMSQFAQNLPHPQYIFRPSIDPLSEKNRELTP